MMKILLTLLGSGLIAFAIGCGDQGSTTKPPAGPPEGMNPDKMKSMMETMKPPDGVGATDAATDAADAAKDDTKDTPKEDAAKEDAPKEDAPKADEKKEEDK